LQLTNDLRIAHARMRFYLTRSQLNLGVSWQQTIDTDMSLRDWRARRVLAIVAVWIVGLLIVAAVRAAALAEEVRHGESAAEVYVAIRLWGGPWLLFGPPLLLSAAWGFARWRSRPAS
jgi:hypothetical protein